MTDVPLATPEGDLIWESVVVGQVPPFTTWYGVGYNGGGLPNHFPPNFLYVIGWTVTKSCEAIDVKPEGLLVGRQHGWELWING